MSTTITRTCDACEAVGYAFVGWVQLTVDDRTTPRIELLASGPKPFDLCPECAKTLEALLTGRLRELEVRAWGT